MFSRFTAVFLLLSARSLLLNAVGDEVAGQKADLSRSRRQLGSGYDAGPIAPNNIRINFINKSGRRAKLFQSDLHGYEIFFKFVLRPNEPKSLLYPPDRTFWIAYDVLTNKLLLINGRTRLESAYVQPGINFDARIHTDALTPEPYRFTKIPPQFVETLVVLDHSMWLEYGDGAVTYITAVMNIVTRAFNHRSLGVPIFVSVTDIVVMKIKPSYYVLKPDRPDISVRAACRYAKEYQNTTKYDFAVVLTRKNIGPEGYASMYTMCTDRSCALVREKGPDTAFVIAHELGHSLGIDHDENDQCKRHNRGGGNLMVQKLRSTSSNYQWSRCSRRMLQQNVKYFKCLQNKPVLMPAFAAAMNSLPGELLDSSTQCRHYLGIAASGCSLRLLSACRYLLCKASPKEQCKPLWWHAPLDGTKCGDKNWCVHGRCVKKVKILPVDGGWSGWTEFRPPCDKIHRLRASLWLIQERNRTCNNPRPKAGGKRCIGITEEYRLMQPSNPGCKPYSLESFLLNKGIGTKALNSMGCQSSRHKNKVWDYYTEEQQMEHIRSLNLTCHFENRRNCGWKSSPLGSKHWNVGRGKTPSANTGPSSDYTHKNATGHYLFFEASWAEKTKPLKSGDRIILVSPKILSPSICLRFAYHMFGKGVKGLEVIVRNGRHHRVMWKKNGNQGDKWHLAEIELALYIDYKITIEAIRGQSYYSDIALDDLSVEFGSCKSDGAAHIECTTICRSADGLSMYRAQHEDGTPCMHQKTSNGVCFKKKCQPVDCNGRIGSMSC